MMGTRPSLSLWGPIESTIAREKTAEVRKGNVGRANEATYDGKGQDGIHH